MAYQDYKRLDILLKKKKNICMQCGFDGSGKSAAFMRGGSNHQFNFSID